MKLRSAISACCLTLVFGASFCVAQSPPAPPGETLPTPKSLNADAASILERLKLIPPDGSSRGQRSSLMPPARPRPTPSAATEYTQQVERIQRKFKMLAERRKQAEAKRLAEEKARAAALAAQLAAQANAKPSTDSGTGDSDELLQPDAIKPALPAPSPSPQLPVNPATKLTGDADGPAGENELSSEGQLENDPLDAAAANAVLGHASSSDASEFDNADEPVTKQTAVEMPAEFLVTSEPIDSLAFANNMFAQGKTAIAKPVYEKLLKLPQTPDDMIWIQYQLASCYRLENQIKEATRYYRIVAADKTTEYWPSRARWWMDYISRSQNMYQRRAELEDRFKKLQEQVRELKQ